MLCRLAYQRLQDQMASRMTERRRKDKAGLVRRLRRLQTMKCIRSSSFNNLRSSIDSSCKSEIARSVTCRKIAKSSGVPCAKLRLMSGMLQTVLHLLLRL